MGPIAPNPEDYARFTQLLQDALSQQQFSSDVLGDLPSYTKSGTDPRIPRTSRAQALIPIPETTTIPHLPSSYGYEYVPVQDIVRQHTARQSEIEILRAAQALAAPPTPPDRPPTQRPRAPRMPLGTVVNPLLDALQLLLYPSDTNEGEAEALNVKRGESRTQLPKNAGTVQPEIRHSIPLLP